MWKISYPFIFLLGQTNTSKNCLFPISETRMTKRFFIFLNPYHFKYLSKISKDENNFDVKNWKHSPAMPFYSEKNPKTNLLIRCCLTSSYILQDPIYRFKWQWCSTVFLYTIDMISTQGFWQVQCTWNTAWGGITCTIVSRVV